MWMIEFRVCIEKNINSSKESIANQTSILYTVV